MALPMGEMLYAAEIVSFNSLAYFCCFQLSQVLLLHPLNERRLILGTSTCIKFGCRPRSNAATEKRKG
uniref:Uncharacterized protein n=1 Tax=Parascaris univalens TaxID=6257 RepID=A0A915BVC6_PARUN